MSGLTKETLEESLKIGLSTREVARGFGISLAVLLRIMERYGMEIQEEQKPTVTKKIPVPVEKEEPNRVKPKGVKCIYIEGKGNRRAQTCFYGGKCGAIDCCDYFMITGQRRPKDKENDKYPYHYCTAYKYISKEQKAKLNRRKKIEEHARQVAHLNQEGEWI